MNTKPRSRRSAKTVLAIATMFLICDASLANARQGIRDARTTGSIAGRVLSGGVPCELTEVELTREGESKDPRVEIAGGNGTGEFMFSGLTPGNYILRVAALTSGSAKRKRAVLAERRVVLKEGQAVSGIDLELAGAVAGSGRVVIADTREPVRAFVFANPVGRQGPSFSGVSNDDGTFRLEGLVPGEWDGYARLLDPGQFYSEKTRFTVGTNEVTNLELRLNRGSTVTGRVVVDGLSDTAPPVDLSGLSLRTSLTDFDTERIVGAWQTTQVDQDGRFTLAGLPPSIVNLIVEKSGPSYDFAVVRVEGSAVVDGLSRVYVNPKAAATEVRIHICYGSGTLGGQIRIENGSLAEGSRIYVDAQRLGSLMIEAEGTAGDVSDDGRFSIARLPAGDYVLSCTVFPKDEHTAIYATCQRITVHEVDTADVTIVIDLAKVGGRMPDCGEDGP